MAKRWIIRPHDAELIRHVERQLQVPPVLAQLLAARGITDPQTADCFLEAKLSGLRDPDLLPGIPAAADHIHRAIQDGKKITVYGDYDADGMTATAILVRCLQQLSADVNYHIPNRLSDGYGLSTDSLRTLSQRGSQVIISVDCGISSIEPARIAQELGLELIITDHHQLGDALPPAVALVHPRLPGHAYPFGELCGAGVAFKLAWALCQRASDAKKVRPALKDFLVAAMGLAAIGTVADVVPLLDENRLLVRHGLHSLTRQPVMGIAALKKITKLDQKASLGSEDIGFTLGPRLNAAGRLGQPQLAVELLVTDSADRADSLAQYLHELNKSRDSLERRIYLAATKQIKDRFDPDEDAALVLADRGWHKGVIGIVAGRLAEKHHRPVVVISWDELGSGEGTGSARTSSGLNLYEALAACQEQLRGFGGHAAAAGLQIDESQIEEFRSRFVEYVAETISPADRMAELRIDAEAPLAQMTLQALTQLEALAPFGHSNPRPLLCTTNVKLDGPAKKMGSGERHLALKLRQHSVSLRAVAFGKGDWAESLEGVTGTIDIAYRPVINQFRGQRNVELHLVDWRETAVDSPEPADSAAESIVG